MTKTEDTRLADDPVLAAAKQLLHECEMLLAFHDDYRVHPDDRRYRLAHSKKWPF